ncbi:MAG: DUF4439 domain-containing protein [Janthinobacterium lividum]
MPEASTGPAARWARRDVLRLGLAIPVLAGCSASPAVSPRPGTSGTTAAGPTPGVPSPAPGPAPGIPAAASAELKLSALAGAVLSGPHRKDLSSGQRRLLTFLRQAHADHGSVLASAEPTARPTSSGRPPSASAPDLKGVSLKDALERLARQEKRQAAAQRRAAASRTGLAALLSGSLAVAADAYAAALGASDPPSVSAEKARKPAALLTDVAATQQLVAQLHAVVFGYQLAIGKLKYASAARPRAVSQLAAARALLDTRIALLLTRKAAVPMAEPAYAPSFDVRSADEARRLVRTMQARLEPFVGLTLAAAGTPRARREALTLLTSTSRTARSWGAPLQAWPGWPD